MLMRFFAVVGCNELIFNPIIEWWRKGPINKQLHTFMWSAAPVHYKVSMTSYMFSYCECSLSSSMVSRRLTLVQTVLPPAQGSRS